MSKAHEHMDQLSHQPQSEETAVTALGSPRSTTPARQRAGWTTARIVRQVFLPVTVLAAVLFHAGSMRAHIG
jgi:hypothetical protein